MMKLILVIVISILSISAGIAGTYIYMDMQHQEEIIANKKALKPFVEMYLWKSERLQIYTVEALTCGGIIDDCWRCKKIYKEYKYGKE